MILYWYDHAYNPLGMPPAPEWYAYAKALRFVCCPGLILHIFQLQMGDAELTWKMWLLAVGLNWPIYYFAGLAVVRVLERE
jgi:hypothetical protein